MKAGILTIGTEITTGEIINTNAAWIAQQLEERGYAVLEHLSVRDDRPAIMSALKRMQKLDLLIVSGGLGPTSDDITREMVSKWAAKKLLFSDKEWAFLNKVYKTRGLTIRDAHRHQCYFPKGSKILMNPVGTAHGFFLKKGKTEVFVLPGPPRELEGMWEAEVSDKLRRGISLPWSNWSVLGMPESEVAEIIEPLIAKTKIEVGYRASIPYVHVKLRGKQLTAAIEKQVDTALQKSLVGKGKQDFAYDFLKSLEGQTVVFQDQVTRGFLSARLSKLAKDLDLNFKVEDCFGDQPFANVSNATCAQISKVKDDPGAIEVTWRDAKQLKGTRIQLPFKIKVDSERGARSAAEWALFKWASWLKA